MDQFERSLRYLFFALLLSVTAVLYGFKGVDKQPSRALQVSQAVAAESESEGGMPERGNFLIFYAYQGQPIEADISVKLNGETIASLEQLSTVSWTTFVDLDTEKGDEAVIDARFMDDGGIVSLHNNFGSLTTGYWANQFNINFYLRDEDGNFVEHLGTMSIAFYLFPPFEGFAFDADPGSIAPGEESRVSMESIELPDEPVIIPDNTSIDMRLSPNGKRLGGYAIPLLDAEGVEEIINFPYGFLANVPLYYRAYPDSTLLEGTSEEVQLGVFSHFNTSIAGQTEVEVSLEEDEIEIIITTEEDSVYPQRTGGGTSTDITVQAVKEDKPVFGFPLELTVHPVPNSGGHDHHDEYRPTGTLEPTSGETDENGIFTTVFTSSEIGGKEWVMVSSVDKTIKDSVKIVVSVPDLVLLESSNLYKKIGGTCNHHGPSDILSADSPCQEPDRNHWVNKSVRDLLVGLSLKWMEDFPNEFILMINDISLPSGGLFDINGNWLPSHHTHRAGRDIDIRTEIPLIREGVPVRNEAGETIGNRAFVNLVEDKGGNANIHDEQTNNEHYHISF